MTPDPVQKAEEEQHPGVPGFQSWRGVYLFILAAFVGMVALLAWFTHSFGR